MTIDKKMLDKLIADRNSAKEAVKNAKTPEEKEKAQEALNKAQADLVNARDSLIEESRKDLVAKDNAEKKVADALYARDKAGEAVDRAKKKLRDAIYSGDEALEAEAREELHNAEVLKAKDNDLVDDAKAAFTIAYNALIAVIALRDEAIAAV